MTRPRWCVQCSELLPLGAGNRRLYCGDVCRAAAAAKHERARYHADPEKGRTRKRVEYVADREAICARQRASYRVRKIDTDKRKIQPPEPDLHPKAPELAHFSAWAVGATRPRVAPNAAPARSLSVR